MLKLIKLWLRGGAGGTRVERRVRSQGRTCTTQAQLSCRNVIVKEKKKKNCPKNIIQFKKKKCLGGCHTQIIIHRQHHFRNRLFRKTKLKRKESERKSSYLPSKNVLDWYRACRKEKKRKKKEKKNSPGRSCCCNYSASVESRAGRITIVKVRLPGSPGEESQMSPFSTTGCQAARQTAAVTGRFEHAFLIVV